MQLPVVINGSGVFTLPKRATITGFVGAQLAIYTDGLGNSNPLMRATAAADETALVYVPMSIPLPEGTQLTNGSVNIVTVFLEI